MSILPHLTVGAAVGSFIPNPYLAAIAGVGSHIIVDSIPHWDPNLKKLSENKKIFYLSLFLLDLALSLGFLYLIWDYPAMVYAGLAAALFDLENFIGIVPFRKIWHQNTNLFWGLFNQSWVTGLAIFVVISKIFGTGF